MIYWLLFKTFFIIGLCCFGGGYAALPFIQNWVVDTYGWLSLTEFIDIVTISQMTPGPIGINAAVFVGIKTVGLLGAVMATLGLILPALVIVLILSKLYLKYRDLHTVNGVLTGLKPAVAALIFASSLTIVRNAIWETGVLKEINIAAICIAAASFFVLKKTRTSPLFVIFGGGVVGIIIYGVLGLG